MIQCWHEHPKKRPTFSMLRAKCDGLLSAQHSNAYIDLQTDEYHDIYNSNELDEGNISSSSCPQSVSNRRHSKISFTLLQKMSSLSPARSILSGASIETDYLKVYNNFIELLLLLHH